MTDAPQTSRVLHAIWGFGAPSETFITDRMIELERLGWEAWVAAKWILPDAEPEFPPAARVLEPSRRAALGARLSGRRRSDPAWWLRSSISSVRPALIHAHFGWTAAEALAAARRHRIPLVASFHGYDATVYPRFGFGAHEGGGVNPTSPAEVYGELFDQADAILATSDYIRGRLVSLGCNARVDVVPSGIRLERFPFRGPRPDEHQDDELRLLFIGRLVPYKGLDVALRAVALLKEAGRLRPPTLTVIGDGPARAELEDLARSLGVGEQVTFLGARDRDFVLEALQRADVLVAPSRTTEAGQAEGLGNVVKEALAVGLEVAVSDNGGLPEVVPGERGPQRQPGSESGGARAVRSRAFCP